MTIKRPHRATRLHVLGAAIALSAIATTAHSADSPDPPGNTGLPCGYEVAAIIQGPQPVAIITFATALNEHGWVAGYWKTGGDAGDRAYYWKPELGDSVFTIPLPAGYTRSFATDINDNGLVVGYMSGAGNPSRGFVYDTSTNAMVVILEPIDPNGFNAKCWANAINNDGVVVGARSLGETENPHNAFIWTPSKDDPTHGTYTDLGVMNGPNSKAVDISDSGIAVGTTGTAGNPNRRGFVYSDGQLEILPAIPSGLESVCVAVNESGTVAGGGLMDPEQVPDFFGLPARWESGAWHLLPILDFCWSTAAFDMDHRGVMVGRCATPQIAESFPLMWIDDEMIDLTPRINTDTGVVVEVIKGINSAGQLLAAGRLNASSAAFLLDPVGPFNGDLNNDCSVGPDDLTILLSEWGKRESPADLNDDGVVNGADLAILLGNWTP